MAALVFLWQYTFCGVCLLLPCLAVCTALSVMVTFLQNTRSLLVTHTCAAVSGNSNAVINRLEALWLQDIEQKIFCHFVPVFPWLPLKCHLSAVYIIKQAIYKAKCRVTATL